MEAVYRSVEGLAETLARIVPYAPLREFEFLRLALLGVLLLAPLCSTIGMQVVNFRLAFFSEAVGHSAFTGVALGLVLGVLLESGSLNGDELWVTSGMIAFGVFVAVAVTFYRRSTTLSSDTVLGVFSAAIIALGICVISLLIDRGHVRGQSVMQTFLVGKSILTVTPAQIVVLMGLFVAIMSVEVFAYNRLMLVGLNPELAQTRGVRVWLYEYIFAVLLALVVMFSIQLVGVLLVTALLVIPGATARNLARSGGSAFWIAAVVALASGVGGLLVADSLNTPAGATIILTMTTLFLASSLLLIVRRQTL